MQNINISNLSVPAEFIVTLYQIMNSVSDKKINIDPDNIEKLSNLNIDPFLENNLEKFKVLAFKDFDLNHKLPSTDEFYLLSYRISIIKLLKIFNSLVLTIQRDFLKKSKIMKEMFDKDKMNIIGTIPIDFETEILNSVRLITKLRWNIHKYIDILFETDFLEEYLSEIKIECNIQLKKTIKPSIPLGDLNRIIIERLKLLSDSLFVVFNNMISKKELDIFFEDKKPAKPDLFAVMKTLSSLLNLNSDIIQFIPENNIPALAFFMINLMKSLIKGFNYLKENFLDFMTEYEI